MPRKFVGQIVVMTAHPLTDSITFILPAFRGQVIISTSILSCHIPGALQGLTDEDDVMAFLDVHRPWDSTTYNMWGPA